MRLDWECVRAILDGAEQLAPRDMLAPGKVAGFDEETVIEHIRLLVEAGLVEGHPKGRGALFVERLTWEGHQCLAVLRSQGLWGRIKAEAKDRGLQLSFDLVRTLGARLLETLL